MRKSFVVALLMLTPVLSFAQRGRGRAPSGPPIVLKPARVFDGEAMHEGWMVLVKGDRIESAGPTIDLITDPKWAMLDARIDHLLAP